MGRGYGGRKTEEYSRVPISSEPAASGLPPPLESSLLCPLVLLSDTIGTVMRSPGRKGEKKHQHR